MDSPIAAAALLTAGALLGYLSSLALARAQHRQALTLRVADEYFAARRELVEIVSKFADVNLLREMSPAERETNANAIGNLFYKNFDLLPRPVLDRLMLLHVALRSPVNGPYCLMKAAVTRMPREEFASFVKRCSIFTNSSLFAPLALSSSNQTIRGNQVVKLHARDVLYTLSVYSSVDELSSLARRVESK